MPGKAKKPAFGSAPKAASLDASAAALPPQPHPAPAPASALADAKQPARPPAAPLPTAPLTLAAQAQARQQAKPLDGIVSDLEQPRASTSMTFAEQAAVEADARANYRDPAEPSPNPEPGPGAGPGGGKKKPGSSTVKRHGMLFDEQLWNDTKRAVARLQTSMLDHAGLTITRAYYIAQAVDKEIDHISKTYLNRQDIDPLTAPYRTGSAAVPKKTSRASSKIKTNISLTQETWAKARRAQQIACAHQPDTYPTLVAFVSTALARQNARYLNK